MHILHYALYILHYTVRIKIKEAVIYLFIVEIYQLEIRASGLNPYPVCLEIFQNILQLII